MFIEYSNNINICRFLLLLLLLFILLLLFYLCFYFIILIIIYIELTHSKTILEITVEIEPQPAALDFKNLSQYSSCSK